MDKTLAELFARHPLCGCFEGNPMDVFGAFIVGEEYGADETPQLLGLYGGRYTIVFRPGECGKLCVQMQSKLTHVLSSFQGLITCHARSRMTYC